MSAIAVTVVVFRDWWQIALVVLQGLLLGYGWGRARTLNKAAKAFDEAAAEYRRCMVALLSKLPAPPSPEQSSDGVARETTPMHGEQRP